MDMASRAPNPYMVVTNAHSLFCPILTFVCCGLRHVSLCLFGLRYFVVTQFLPAETKDEVGHEMG